MRLCGEVIQIQFKRELFYLFLIHGCSNNIQSRDFLHAPRLSMQHQNLFIRSYPMHNNLSWQKGKYNDS